MQTFILIDEQRRQRAIDFIKMLSIKRPMMIEIKEYRKNRSNAQNRTYWMWVHIIAEHYGYEDEELHEALKSRLLGTEGRNVFGESVLVTKSTRKLTTAEFADYLGKIEILADELQIRLPKPDDYRFAMMLDAA